MASESWNARPAGSHNPEPPPQPTLYVPYADSNNICDHGPPSTSLTGFVQPTPPMPQLADRPHLSSNHLILQNQHWNYLSQPLGPRPVVHDRHSCSAAQAYATVCPPPPSLVSWGTDQQFLPDPTIRTSMQEVEHTSQYPSTTASARQLKRMRTTAACDHCRDLRIKCDEKTPCDSCEKKNIECKRKDYPLTKSKAEQLAEMLALQQKTYDAVSSLNAMFDGLRLVESRNSLTPAHSLIEHLFSSANRSARGSTKESDSHHDSQDRSTSPSTTSIGVPTASPGEVEQESLTAYYDEAEWDSDKLSFYIGKYYEATVHSNDIIPRKRLDRAVNQFLKDRECWPERSSADIDVAILFLVFAIGKLHTNGPGSSFRPLSQPYTLGQGTQAHGYTFLELGKEMLYGCSTHEPVDGIRATALMGLYYYQAGVIPVSFEYLGSASQFARNLILPEINELYPRRLSNELSPENRDLFQLYIACLALEREFSQTMLGGF